MNNWGVLDFLRIIFVPRIEFHWLTILQGTAAAVGIATGAKALFGGDQSSQDRGAARDAAGASAKYYDQLAQIGGEQWQLFKDKALPLLDEMKGSRLNEADYTNRAADEVKTQYGAARANLRRNLELSRSPADPAYGAILAPSYMDEAAQTSKAISDARRYVNEENFRRTGVVAGAYSGFPAGASSAIGRATTGAINTARTYSGLSADAATRQAQQAYGGFNLAANAGRWFGGPRPATGAIPGPSFESMNQGNFNYNASIDPYSSEYLPAGNYSGGYAGGGPIRRGGYAEGGGVIRGPGTGRSDSIRTRARPGTYVLSADTVRAIGTKKVRDLIESSGVRPGEGGHGYTGVPIRVSDGEAEIPPETVQHYGEEFFSKLQQKYHRPVASDSGMANGGVIRTRGLPHSVENAIYGVMPARAIGHSRRH